MIDCRFWENTIWCGEVKRFNVTKPKTIHGFSTTGKTIFNIREGINFFILLPLTAQTLLKRFVAKGLAPLLHFQDYLLYCLFAEKS
jgi:hypothetical protein